MTLKECYIAIVRGMQVSIFVFSEDEKQAVTN